jgi:SulP family sulfate permease
VTLGFSGLSDIMRASFEKADFFGTDRPHQLFTSRNEAVEWCEDMLLLYHEVGAASTHSFESWLQSEFGENLEFEKIAPYMQRQDLDNGEFLFRQGEPSDSLVLQASGSVAITIIDEHGRPIRLRRMIGHTVVGEMGFYRRVPRTASVVAEGPTVIYRLTREAFDRMQAENPTAAAAFHKLIIRLLSDRLEFANREISALL